MAGRVKLSVLYIELDAFAGGRGLHSSTFQLNLSRV